MKVSLKNKIAIGIVFLFSLMIISSGMAIYYFNQLKNDAKSILKDNYETLTYCQAIQQSLDSYSQNPQKALADIEEQLKLQEQNVTEKGEGVLTQKLRSHIEILKKDPKTFNQKNDSLRFDLQNIAKLNLLAMEKKNVYTQKASDEAQTYLSVAICLIFIVAFTFILNFPGYISKPIAELTEAITAISEKNYAYRIHEKSDDEFGALATTFNTMAHKLEMFETSNLAQLMFEKARTEAVINSLKDASIGVDKNGVVLFVNQEALHLLNTSKLSLVGQPIERVISQNDLLRYTIESDETKPFKIVLDGKEAFFIKEKIDITAQGEKLGVAYTIKNITTYQEKDIAKTNFLATISHELKTPLASTDLGLKMLKDEKFGSLSQDQKEILDDLSKDNSRLIKLVSELLDLTQLETGNIQLKIQECDLPKALEYSMQAVQHLAKQYQVTLLTKLPADLPRVQADEEKLSWVIINLLSNAIRYTGIGKQVTIMANIHDKILQLSVIDQGMGIKPEFKTKIFERFFHIDEHKSTGKGNGLGLAISKEFIEAMGGNIYLTDNPAGGSVFTIDMNVV